MTVCHKLIKYNINFPEECMAKTDKAGGECWDAGAGDAAALSAFAMNSSGKLMLFL